MTRLLPRRRTDGNDEKRRRQCAIPDGECSKAGHAACSSIRRTLRTLKLSDSDVFRFVLDEVKDFAIVFIDPEGRIEKWNDGAEVVFGYEAGEVAGRHFDLLFTDEDRERRVPATELDTARNSGRAEDARWHLRKDRTLVFVDGVTTAIRDEAGTLAGYAKIARDATDRYRTEQRLAAQLALTKVLNENEPLNTIARRIMQTICESLEWDMGGLWEVGSGPKGERIHCVEQWHSTEIDPVLASKLCTGLEFQRGKGLPGEVWETGRAVWIASFTDASRYTRAESALKAGLRSAFAFPILSDGNVIGVMEFFSRDERKPDQGLMPAMTLIGAQIGEYVSRRRTAEALRESEEQYRVVAETAQDAIFTIDETSTVLFCNPAVEKLFGYKPAEMVGKKLELIIPERLRDAHRRGINRFLQSRERRIPWTGVELPAVHRDGHEFPVEISFGEWTGQGRTIFTGFATDITERKRAAEALRATLELEQKARADAESVREQLERRAEEESSFRHLASALNGAIEMTDVLYEITNRATQVTRADGVYVERIVGTPMTVEVVASAGRGTPARGLRVGYPGSMTEEMMKRREPVILADMKGFGRAMAPYLADTCANCQVLVTPLIAEEEPLGALVLLNSRASGREFGDSDIVRARTLGDLTSLALRRVRLLEHEREAKEKAEAAVRVRDETLGIVSHDLRNPLTKIALSADLLSAAPAEDHGELIDTIRTAARQMQRLIQDLLDVARVEAGRFSVDKKLISAESLVREACDSNQAIAEQRGQTIVSFVGPELPEICADRDRLLQVFGNLIGNAIKFTPERGTITVEAVAVEEGVEFRVSDTGPGLPDGEIRNVFRPYWQAKKTAHMGAGLGLAIVRGIVEAHRGRVWAENSRSGGAIFTFVVPPG